MPAENYWCTKCEVFGYGSECWNCGEPVPGPLTPKWATWIQTKRFPYLSNQASWAPTDDPMAFVAELLREALDSMISRR